MDYPGFWYAIAPYGLALQPRDHCDRQIRFGVLTVDEVLKTLKYMAEDEIKALQGLKRRPVTPWVTLVHSH